MGHVYSTRTRGTVERSGSSAMPHFGHAPAVAWRTSGSIGQKYSVPAGASVIAASGRGVRNDSGFALKRSRHDVAQK